MAHLPPCRGPVAGRSRISRGAVAGRGVLDDRLGANWARIGCSRAPVIRAQLRLTLRATAATRICLSSLTPRCPGTGLRVSGRADVTICRLDRAAIPAAGNTTGPQCLQNHFCLVRKGALFQVRENDAQHDAGGAYEIREAHAVGQQPAPLGVFVRPGALHQVSEGDPAHPPGAARRIHGRGRLGAPPPGSSLRSFVFSPEQQSVRSRER